MRIVDSSTFISVLQYLKVDHLYIKYTITMQVLHFEILHILLLNILFSDIFPCLSLILIISIILYFSN